MSIQIRLSSEHFNHFEYAISKSKVDYGFNGPSVTLTGDNYRSILAALEAMHSRTFKIKTKTVVHMERLHALQEIIRKVQQQAVYFPKVEEPVNENVEEVEQVEEPEAANVNSIDETADKDVA